MVATFNGNPGTKIIPCNNLSNAGDETNLYTYNELSSLLCNIPKRNVVIIRGVMNAQIGNKRIQLTELVKQRLGTPNLFLTRKWTYMT